MRDMLNRVKKKRTGHYGQKDEMDEIDEKDMAKGQIKWTPILGQK